MPPPPNKIIQVYDFYYTLVKIDYRLDTSYAENKSK